MKNSLSKTLLGGTMTILLLLSSLMIYREAKSSQKIRKPCFGGKMHLLLLQLYTSFPVCHIAFVVIILCVDEQVGLRQLATNKRVI